MSAFSRLSLQETPVQLSSSLLCYSAFQVAPTPEYLDPKLSLEALTEILSRGLSLNVDKATISKLRAIPVKLSISPGNKETAPDVKPNLLLLLASWFKLKIIANPRASKSQLIKSLDYSVDIFIPRKVLTSLIVKPQDGTWNKVDWEVYACRFTDDGPLFVDRKSSYSTNPQSAGELFQNAMTTPQDHRRVYGVRKLVLPVADKGEKSLSIVVSGEINCLDASGEPVELTCKPDWKHHEKWRTAGQWIKSKLGGVERMVIGNFTGSRTNSRSRDSHHLTFRDADFEVMNLKQFERLVDREDKTDAFPYAARMLSKIIKRTRKVGYYHFTRNTEDLEELYVDDGEGKTPFPISDELISNCAQAVIDLQGCSCHCSRCCK
jgi:hypothetical protein